MVTERQTNRHWFVWNEDGATDDRAVLLFRDHPFEDRHQLVEQSRLTMQRSRAETRAARARVPTRCAPRVVRDAESNKPRSK
jgi:hypothetical protein